MILALINFNSMTMRHFAHDFAQSFHAVVRANASKLRCLILAPLSFGASALNVFPQISFSFIRQRFFSNAKTQRPKDAKILEFHSHPRNSW